MRFFEGFAWALPAAFAGALAAYRFEQGDVLFRDREAYDPIEENLPAGATAIQILHPPRSARALPAESEGDRRRSSWESEVRIALVDLSAGTEKFRSISQGKLLMAIWRGDEGWLDPDREEPPLPLAGRDLAGRLERARGAFDAEHKTRRGCRFLFVLDLASDASRVKAQAIEEALATVGAVERVDLLPGAAGLEDANDFHPALVLRGLAVRGASSAQVERALRGTLYGGAAKLESEQGETPSNDRFSVARHGLLDEIGA